MKEQKIYGLVVCGGRSTRMGRDKSLLDYHGKPQRYYLYDLLSQVCERSFISCNRQQAEGILPGYEYIIDDPVYGDIGPMNAILSAFDCYPDISFLAIGCDYPLFDLEDIRLLADKARAEDHSVAVFNAQTGFIEPLLAVYHSRLGEHLTRYHRDGNSSLRLFLESQPFTRLGFPDNSHLVSVDNRNDYLKVSKRSSDSR